MFLIIYCSQNKKIFKGVGADCDCAGGTVSRQHGGGERESWKRDREGGGRGGKWQGGKREKERGRTHERERDQRGACREWEGGMEQGEPREKV
jgi:hypothetical protein